MKSLVIFLVLNLLDLSYSFIAYDCQDQGMNITTVSLTELGQCKTPAKQVSVKRERIQLIQIRETESLPIIQCKIHITRMVTHCGMHSHSSMMANGLSTYIYPISRDLCTEAHRFKSLRNFYGQHIEHLTINGTTSATVRIAGKIDKHGNCKGISFEDQKGKWEDVVVQAAVEITLFQRHAPTNIDENQIVLPGGITCPYKDKMCIDSIFGYTFWDHVDNEQCSPTKYLVLYEGEADRISPTNLTDINSQTIVYSVSHGNTIFAMPISNPTMICGQIAYETDHPKFFIIRASELGIFYFRKSQIDVFNMDPTAYVNSKIFFVERHIQKQVTALYHNVLTQKCELEQQVLRNLQTLAVIAPAEFANAKKKVPGFTAVNYGEVVHLIQCSPVEVQIRSTDRCYHELPILYDNQTLFMAPRSHIIQKYANEIGCNPFLFPAYKLNSHWYKIAKQAQVIPTPQILEPDSEPDWAYVNPTNLFSGGLYTQEDMDRLRRQMILPVERQAVEGILARGAMGMSPDMQGISFEGVIGEETIKGWAKQLWSTLFEWVTTLGSITSGVMGVFIIFKCVKFLADTIIHGFLLYDIFGWSFKIVGALLDSVTMFCVHAHARRGVPSESQPKVKSDPVEDPTGSTTTPRSMLTQIYPGLEMSTAPAPNRDGSRSTANPNRDWAIP